MYLLFSVTSSLSFSKIGVRSLDSGQMYLSQTPPTVCDVKPCHIYTFTQKNPEEQISNFDKKVEIGTCLVQHPARYHHRKHTLLQILKIQCFRLDKRIISGHTGLLNVISDQKRNKVEYSFWVQSIFTLYKKKYFKILVGCTQRKEIFFVKKFVSVFKLGFSVNTECSKHSDKNVKCRRYYILECMRRIRESYQLLGMYVLYGTIIVHK